MREIEFEAGMILFCTIMIFVGVWKIVRAFWLVQEAHRRDMERKSEEQMRRVEESIRTASERLERKEKVKRHIERAAMRDLMTGESAEIENEPERRDALITIDKILERQKE